jgi:16S rRNA (uracil1498-N3)-methyltransferase
VPQLRAGEIALDPAQARHARDALRLTAGDAVEVFDDAGNSATGELVRVTGGEVIVRVDSLIQRSSPNSFRWTIAAAVPKGERADWMIEKLSELGTAEFIPLAAERSVVLPEGKNKRERWMRIATESAKQSRRVGVMRIGELTSVRNLLATIKEAPDITAWYFSTAIDAQSVSNVTSTLKSLVALIGPEGGWTDTEVAAFSEAKLTPVRLTRTVLRVETAAVAAAAVIGSLVNK